MNTRIVAAMVGMGAVIGLLVGLLIGALVFRQGTAPIAQPLPTPTVASQAEAVESPTADPEPVLPRPDGKPLVQLADRICQGDTKAVAELIAATDKLYEGINFQRDTRRVMDNLVVVSAAFDIIGASRTRRSGQHRRGRSDQTLQCQPAESAVMLR